MKAKKQVNRFYPERSNYQSDQQFQEVRNLYDMVYRMHDAKPGDPSNTEMPEKAGGPSNTKIGGLYVKGVPPSHSSSPTYNQNTGQFEYQTAGGSAVPATSSAPGFTGQIATDGTYIYIAVATGSGTNTWKRAALSTF